MNAVLNVIAAFFRAHQRTELEAVMRISLSVLNMSAGLAVLLAGYGVLELEVVQLVVFTAVLSLGLSLMVRKLARPSFSLDWRAYRKLLVTALPFALSSIFIFVYDGTPVIFLSLIKGDWITGLYSGAMNFVRIFGLLPARLVGAVLPEMAQFWQPSPDAWSTIYRRSLKYLLVMALPIAVGLVLLSDEFVLLILGEEYADSALILRMRSSG